MVQHDTVPGPPAAASQPYSTSSQPSATSSQQSSSTATPAPRRARAAALAAASAIKSESAAAEAARWPSPSPPPITTRASKRAQSSPPPPKKRWANEEERLALRAEMQARMAEARKEHEAKYKYGPPLPPLPSSIPSWQLVTPLIPANRSVPMKLEPGQKVYATMTPESDAAFVPTHNQYHHCDSSCFLYHPRAPLVKVGVKVGGGGGSGSGGSGSGGSGSGGSGGHLTDEEDSVQGSQVPQPPTPRKRRSQKYVSGIQPTSIYASTDPPPRPAEMWDNPMPMRIRKPEFKLTFRLRPTAEDVILENVRRSLDEKEKAAAAAAAATPPLPIAGPPLTAPSPSTAAPLVPTAAAASATSMAAVPSQSIPTTASANSATPATASAPAPAPAMTLKRKRALANANAVEAAKARLVAERERHKRRRQIQAQATDLAAAATGAYVGFEFYARQQEEIRRLTAKDEAIEREEKEKGKQKEKVKVEEETQAGAGPSQTIPGEIVKEEVTV